MLSLGDAVAEAVSVGVGEPVSLGVVETAVDGVLLGVADVEGVGAVDDLLGVGFG